MEFLKRFALCISGLLLAIGLSAQEPSENITVKGEVLTVKSDAVIGAGVMLKGTTQGVVTDMNGEFTINVPANGVLQVSCIGYKTVDVNVDNRAKITITLAEDTELIDETVVVGYGTQRKITTTGSVTTTTGDRLQKSSSMNLSQGLAGRMSGVIVNNRSGEPGRDDAVMYIRGRSTLGDNSPLIIIDGIPGRGDEFSRMNGDEIESVTVLKDASAAIYGARSANGVILVTTKRGQKGTAPTVQFSYDLGLQQPTKMIEMADAVQFAEAYNASNAITGQPPQYQDYEIEAYRTGSDLVRYPNTNWWDELIKPVSAQHKYGVTLNGGNDRVTYFVSANGQMQDGIYYKSATKFNQVNVRSNIDVQVTDNFKIGFDMSARQQNKNYSAFPGQDYGIFYQTLRAFPTATAYYPNGLLRWGANPVALVQDITGYDKTKINTINTTITAKWDLDFITKGLSVEGHVAYDLVNSANKSWQTPWEGYDYNEVTQEYDKKVYTEWAYPSLSQNAKAWNTLTMNAILNYNRQFGDHNVSAMAGFEQSSEKYEYFSAARTKYESTAIDQLFAGSADQAYWKNSGSASETARRSYFARIGYDYKSKYMVQFIGRYDGSENFAKDKRWGFFPSVSAGWRISEEGFMDGADWLTNLKIRGSYGEQGNDKIDPFQYMTTYDYKTGVYYQQQLGGASVSTIVPGTIANPNVTWEVATKQNYGVDMKFFNDRLSLSADFFFEDRKNILVSNASSLPAITGQQATSINFGRVKNHGYELTLRWDDRIGEVHYSIAPSLTYARNKIIEQAEVPQIYDHLYRTGHPVGQPFGYEFFEFYEPGETEKRYQAAYGAAMPNQNADVKAGDCIYVDLTGDGAIDSNDQHAIGFTDIPEYNASLNMSLSWKGFDISMLWIGASNVNRQLDTYYRPQFGSNNTGALLQWVYDNSWRPDHVEGATLPRLTFANQAHNTYNSSVWLIDASYIRLKNAEIGYTFKKIPWLPQVGSVRLYATGYNLLTFTDFKANDPEASGAAYGTFMKYPMTRVYNFGIKVNF